MEMPPPKTTRKPKKKQPKKRGPSKHTRLLANALAACRRELEDAKRAHRLAGGEIGKLQEMFNDAADKVRTLVVEKQTALEAYYELGQCLTATREAWLAAEGKLGRSEHEFTVEARAVKDGTDSERKPGP